MVRAVFNSVLEVIRQLLNGVGFTPVPNGLSSLINKQLVLFWFYFTQLKTTLPIKTVTDAQKIATDT